MTLLSIGIGLVSSAVADEANSKSARVRIDGVRATDGLIIDALTDAGAWHKLKLSAQSSIRGHSAVVEHQPQSVGLSGGGLPRCWAVPEGHEISDRPGRLSWDLAFNGIRPSAVVSATAGADGWEWNFRWTSGVRPIELQCFDARGNGRPPTRIVDCETWEEYQSGPGGVAYVLTSPTRREDAFVISTGSSPVRVRAEQLRRIPPHVSELPLTVPESRARSVRIRLTAPSEIARETRVAYAAWAWDVASQVLVSETSAVEGDGTVVLAGLGSEAIEVLIQATTESGACWVGTWREGVAVGGTGVELSRSQVRYRRGCVPYVGLLSRSGSEARGWLRRSERTQESVALGTSALEQQVAPGDYLMHGLLLNGVKSAAASLPVRVRQGLDVTLLVD